MTQRGILQKAQIISTVMVTSVEDEHGIINGESFECDWCGVTFTKVPITTKRKTRYYCSSDCSRAEDFFVFAIMSGFGFFVSIAALIVHIPERFGTCLLGIIIGFIGFFCSLDIRKIRRRTPKGSRKEQYLDNEIG